MRIIILSLILSTGFQSPPLAQPFHELLSFEKAITHPQTFKSLHLKQTFYLLFVLYFGNLMWL